MKPKAAHGTRSRYYYHGCRCARCRGANAAYQRARRKPTWRGLVPATQAVRHVKNLTKQHVGARVVQDVTGVNRRTVYMMRSGRHKLIQARVADRILSVDQDARADKSLVSSEQTYKIIDWFIAEGCTPAEIRKRIKLNWQFPIEARRRNKITARNALRIQRYFLSLFAGDDEGPPKRVWSGKAGL